MQICKELDPAPEKVWQRSPFHPVSEFLFGDGAVKGWRCKFHCHPAKEWHLISRLPPPEGWQNVAKGFWAVNGLLRFFQGGRRATQSTGSSPCIGAFK